MTHIRCAGRCGKYRSLREILIIFFLAREDILERWCATEVDAAGFMVPVSFFQACTNKSFFSPAAGQMGLVRSLLLRGAVVGRVRVLRQAERLRQQRRRHQGDGLRVQLRIHLAQNISWWEGRDGCCCLA